MRSCVLGVLTLFGLTAYAFAATPADMVRVRLLYTHEPVRLGATGPFQVQLRDGGKIYPVDISIRVRAMGRTLVFARKSFKGEVIASPVSSTDTLKLNGRRYRGSLVFHPLGRGRFDVVEILGMQEYLYGVLPKEVDPTWPLDALKAQAVVSRTYAQANKQSQAQERFDVSNSVYDQVYGGADAESPQSNQAVDQTENEVLLDPMGKPIQAFFHSSCGGHTELPQHVWRSSDPNDLYGDVTETYCDADPHFKWQFEISFAAIRQRLRRAGVRVREIKKIIIPKKTNSGRAEVVRLVTSGGTVDVSGNKFRLAMGADSLRSTLFVEMNQTKRRIWFEGRGWGHGVGLCQWGARGRALAGQDYKAILKTYYPKAKLAHGEVIARSGATKQSVLPSDRLLRFARNDGK